MIESRLQGHAGGLHVQTWEHPDPTHAVVIAHGYGEHIGRYDHVAVALAANGAAVYGLDHIGHGRSDVERALITDFEPVVGDLHLLVERVRAEQPARPIVLLGHSMGGLVAARYAQLHGDGLAAVVLSAPLIGSHASSVLLAVEPLPEVPIDPSVLSRDESVQREYSVDPLVYHGPFKRATLAAMAAALLEVALDSQRITGPVLWQHGEADQLVPLAGSDRLFQLLGNAQLTQRHYPDARHEIFNELNSNDILCDTTQYLSDIVRRR